MKTIFFFLFFILSVNVFSQNLDFRPTRVYEGYLKSNSGRKMKINMNFLILLDSTIVGSYHYVPKNGDLKLAGKLKKDNSFILYEWDSNEQNTGIFNGRLSIDKKNIQGEWKSKHNKLYSLKLTETKNETYWSIIKKNRNLFEFKDFKSILENPNKVLSIDMADKNLSELPTEFNKLSKINSINLMGNKFTEFPIVLTTLKTLDEISLSTNKLKKITSKIEKLNNLKVLILNNNQLAELPKEIGKLSNLKYLELGNNYLTNLPEEIKYLTKLEELHIERNNFSEREKLRIKKLLPNCIIYY